MNKVEILFADRQSMKLDFLATQPLSLSTSKRLATLATQDRRHQFLLGRWLIGHALGIRIEDIEEGKEGYPLVTGLPDWHASISHSDRFVAVAISRGFRCGLDIEYPKRERNWLALAERAFAPSELAWVAAKPELTRQRFHQIWTLREATYKAGLRSEVIASHPAIDTQTGQALGGVFWHYLEQTGCAISLAAPRCISVSLRLVGPDHA